MNGAPLGDPTPKGTIPQKTRPDQWNRLFHQKPDGTFEDVTEKAGLQGAGYGMGVAVGDYDNDGYEDLYVPAMVATSFTTTTVMALSPTSPNKQAWAAVVGRPAQPGLIWTMTGGSDLVVLRYMQWDFDDHLVRRKRKEGFELTARLTYSVPSVRWCTTTMATVILPRCRRRWASPNQAKDWESHLRTTTRMATSIFLLPTIPWQSFLYHNKGNGTFEEVGLASGDCGRRGGTRLCWNGSGLHGLRQ